MPAFEYVDSEVGVFNIPEGVVDLAHFRQWIEGDKELDFGRVGWLNGKVWVDLSREELYTHNQVKAALAVALMPFVRAEQLGRYFPDGVRLSNSAADLSGQPDGVFVSFAALERGRCRQVPSRQGRGLNELKGSPDLVVEVVSRSSVVKGNPAASAGVLAGSDSRILVDRRSPLVPDV